jgi:Holliday junction resolvase RusA-like endonuclease
MVEPKNSHYYMTVIRVRNFLATKKKRHRIRSFRLSSNFLETKHTHARRKLFHTLNSQSLRTSLTNTISLKIKSSFFSATKKTVEPKNSHYYQTVIRVRNFLATKKPLDPAFFFLRNQTNTRRKLFHTLTSLSLRTPLTKQEHSKPELQTQRFPVQ